MFTNLNVYFIQTNPPSWQIKLTIIKSFSHKMGLAHHPSPSALWCKHSQEVQGVSAQVQSSTNECIHWWMNISDSHLSWGQFWEFWWNKPCIGYNCKLNKTWFCWLFLLPCLTPCFLTPASWDPSLKNNLHLNPFSGSSFGETQTWCFLSSSWLCDSLLILPLPLWPVSFTGFLLLAWSWRWGVLCLLPSSRLPP